MTNLFDDLPAPPVGPYGPLPRGPLASPADPVTSVDAGERHLKSGKLGANCKVALELVRLYPGKTAVELFNAQGDMGSMNRHEMSRRLADLKNAGLVKHGPARACEFAPHSTMVTWEAV